MPSSSGSSMKRACDACHVRKLKCIKDSALTCQSCSQAALKCTYNAPPQKKGPKSSRGRIILELRNNQRPAAHRSTSPSQDESIYQSAPAAALPVSHRLKMLSVDLVESSIDFFFDHLYPTEPVINRSMVERAIPHIRESAESYCLIASLCAYMLIQPGMRLKNAVDHEVEASRPNPSEELAESLLAAVIDTHRWSRRCEYPTQVSIATSFFLFASYFCLEKQNMAWFHLREATTLAILLGMHQEANYSSRDSNSIARRRCFWSLFVTERAYALQMQRPLTLHPTIALPDRGQDPDEERLLEGFHSLVNLYLPFDDVFVGLWNQSAQGATVAWVIRLQEQLTAALPRSDMPRSTETQAVDLRTSQQWLRVMIWQLSVSNQLLSSTAPEGAMTFKYPIHLSRELAADAVQFSQDSMEIHGIGFIKKLFDIACTLIDVMALVPLDSGGFELGPRDYLQQFVHIMSGLRGGHKRYLPLLVHKAQEALPNFCTAPRISNISLGTDLGGADRKHQTATSTNDDERTNPKIIPRPRGAELPLCQPNCWVCREQGYLLHQRYAV